MPDIKDVTAQKLKGRYSIDDDIDITGQKSIGIKRSKYIV